MKVFNLVLLALILQMYQSVAAQESQVKKLNENKILCAQKIDITVNGLVCDFCARALEKTFKKQKDVDWIAVNLDSGNIGIGTKPGADISDATIKDLVVNAGYNTVDIKRVCL